MSVYRIYSNKDATIRNEPYSDKNEGYDEVLEVGKYVDINFNGTFIYRSLIEFQLGDIVTKLNQASITTASNYKFYLNLTSIEEVEVPRTHQLWVYPVSSSWNEGIGSFSDQPRSTKGVSWDKRDTSVAWKTSSYDNLSSGGVTFYGTGSYRTNDEGGGNWYYASGSTSNTYNVSQSFDWYQYDARFDVTEIVNDWLSFTGGTWSTAGNLPNNGFIIKFADSVEADALNYGIHKFFSSQTHTIFPPTLEVAYDDSTYTTGTPIDEDSDVRIYDKSPAVYKELSKKKIYVYVRNKYPARTFSTASRYLNRTNVLPSKSYWAVKEKESNIFIIDYNNDYTKLSCDGTKNYFTMDFNSLQPGRFYQFEYKVDLGSGFVEYYEGSTFKIIS